MNSKKYLCYLDYSVIGYTIMVYIKKISKFSDKSKKGRKKIA